MLHGKLPRRKQIQTLEVDGVQVDFSLARERTKVNMHVIHTLLGLIT